MRGHDLRNFCRDLMSHVRDLLVVKVAGDAAEGLDANDAERRELARAAGEFSESDLVRFFHSLTETERTLREGAAHPRYQLEIGLVKLIEMRRLAPLGQIIERLNALEEALRTGKTPAAAPGTTAPSSAPSGSAGGGGRGTPPGSRAFAPADEAKRQASPPPPPLNASTPAASRSEKFNAGAQQQSDNSFSSNTTTPAAGVASAADTPPWGDDDGYSTTPPPLKLVPPAPESNGQPAPSAPQAATGAAAAKTPASAGSLVERIKSGLEDRRKPLLAIALEGARQVSVEGEEIYVEFAPETKHLRDNLSKPESVKLLREVCESVCGRAMGVRIVVKEKGESDEAAAGTRSADAEEKQRLRERAENHPSVQQVLRTFQAEIVDVSRE